MKGSVSAIHAAASAPQKPFKIQARRRRITLARNSFALLALVSAVLATSRDARADDAERALDETRVPLHVEIEGNVRVEQGKDFTISCMAPCILHVPPGYLRLTMPSETMEIHVERESTVRQTAGVPALRSAGAIALIGGGIVVVAAVLIPLIVCAQRTNYVDSAGRGRRSDNVCDGLSISDGVKVAWIAGAGVGLTAAIAGGIVLATAGPHTRVTPIGSSARAAPPHFSITPSFVIGAPHARERLVPGVSLSVAF